MLRQKADGLCVLLQCAKVFNPIILMNGFNESQSTAHPCYSCVLGNLCSCVLANSDASSSTYVRYARQHNDANTLRLPRLLSPFIRRTLWYFKSLLLIFVHAFF